MICIITKPVDLGRYVEVQNLLNVHPSEKVCHIDWADLSGLRSGETLYISGHGSPNSIERHNARDFAALLIRRGLVATVPLKKIKLLSCGGGKMSTGHVPFCQQVADELASQGGPQTVVVGLDGETAVTDQKGKTWAKDVPQSSYPNWSDFTSNFGTEFKNLDAAAKSFPSDNERQLRENAAKLTGLSSKMFAWLYQENAKHVKQRPGGLKDPSAKTYGIPGQRI